jgi:tetratricopeptide (TPR) repeat protein
MSPPLSTQELSARGYECLNKGEVDRARSFFDKALQLDKYDEQALLGRGLTFYVKNSVEHASKALREILKRNPASAEASWQLAMTYEIEAGQRGNAVKAYQHFIQHVTGGDQHEYRMWHAQQRIKTIQGNAASLGNRTFFLDLGILVISETHPPFRTRSLYEVPVEHLGQVTEHLKSARNLSGGAIYATALSELVQPFAVSLP